MSSNDITQVSGVHDTVAILSQTREILNDGMSTMDHKTHSHNQNQRMDQDQTVRHTEQNTGFSEQQTLYASRLQGFEMQHINNSAQPDLSNIPGTNSTHNSDAPIWLTNVLQGFDKKWSKIETHLQKQEIRWQNVASQNTKVAE